MTANEAKRILLALKNETHLFGSICDILLITVSNCVKLLNADKTVALKQNEIDSTIKNMKKYLLILRFNE